MRIPAHENFTRDLVDRLRADGHDVAWVREDARGSPDEVVLSRAQDEDRIVATFDKGFGELAFHAHLPASSGVLLFRIRGPAPGSAANRALQALNTRDDGRGRFATITNEGVRIRPIPLARGRRGIPPE